MAIMNYQRKKEKLTHYGYFQNMNLMSKKKTIMNFFFKSQNNYDYFVSLKKSGCGLWQNLNCYDFLPTEKQEETIVIIMIIENTGYDFFSKKHDTFILWFVYNFPVF